MSSDLLFPLPPINELSKVKIYITKENLKPIGYCKVISYDDKSVKLEVIDTGQYIYINRRSFHFGTKNDLLNSETPIVRLSDKLNIKLYGEIKTKKNDK